MLEHNLVMTSNFLRSLIGHKSSLLRFVVFAVVVLWLVAQVVVAIEYWGARQYSDPGGYQQLAEECYERGTWYPDRVQIADDGYIFNPGYVNFLLLVLKLFGSLTVMPIVNILLNCVFLLEVYFLTKRLAGCRVAYIAVILFCLLRSNLFSAVVTFSELLFCVMLYGSFCVFRKKRVLLFAAGLILGLSGYVRPTTFVFAIPAVIYIIVCYKDRIGAVSYVGGYIASYLVLAGLNWAMLGQFRPAGSTTAGVNLLMGANDYAGGGYCEEILVNGEDGTAGLDNLDVYDRDSIWTAQAIRWISDNPGKYVSLMPRKLFFLWMGDEYHVISFVPMEEIPAHGNMVRIVLNSGVYYVICLLCLLCLWRKRRELLGSWGILFLPAILASGVHLLSVGAIRYHCPYMPILILFAATQLNFICAAAIKRCGRR